MNTTEFLTITTAICPDKDAIIFEGKRLTFAQLNERVNRLANALLALGIQKGDRVAMIQVNTNQCIEAYFAAARAGGIYVPLNFRARGNELTYMLNTAEANTLFVGDRYLDLIDSIRPGLTT
ncbi:MAG TPA: AMP-binding protein, partial [Dehalococcoidales bacterium]